MIKYFVVSFLNRNEKVFPNEKFDYITVYAFARNVVNRLFKDSNISDDEKKVIIVKYLKYSFEKAKRFNSIFSNYMVDSFKESLEKKEQIDRLKDVSSSNFEGPYL